MVGVFWGSPLFGWLSDNHGRKLTLCICFCLSFVSMAAVRFVSGPYTFLILCFLRMLDGAGAIGGIAAAFVLISEVFESKVTFLHEYLILRDFLGICENFGASNWSVVIRCRTGSIGWYCCFEFWLESIVYYYGNAHVNGDIYLVLQRWICSMVDFKKSYWWSQSDFEKNCKS